MCFTIYFCNNNIVIVKKQSRIKGEGGLTGAEGPGPPQVPK